MKPNVVQGMIQQIEQSEAQGHINNGIDASRPDILSTEHHSDAILAMANTKAYLERHKISILFEELLAQLIQDQSNDPRKAIAEFLMQKKTQRSTYFNESDFESIFEYFDSFDSKTVKLPQLSQGLQIIGINKSIDELTKYYDSITKKGYVYQNEFIDILKNEYALKLQVKQ